MIKTSKPHDQSLCGTTKAPNRMTETCSCGTETHTCMTNSQTLAQLLNMVSQISIAIWLNVILVLWDEMYY
jgi:hypothetical protein